MNRLIEKKRHISRCTQLCASFVVTVIITTLLFSFSPFQVLEWRLSDYWARINKNQSIAEDVAVIGVDEALFQQLNFEWPLKKDLYAEMIFYLQEMGATAIAFDIQFTHRTDTNDSLFLDMIATSSDVVIGYGFYISKEPVATRRLQSIPDRLSCGSGTVDGYHVSGALPPYNELLTVSMHGGFINRGNQFPDGVEREMPLLLSQDSLLFPSLALEAVRVANKNRNACEIENQSSIFLSFTDSIPQYSMSKVLRSFQAYINGEKPEIGKKELDNRIVFIGNSAPSLGDYGITPLTGKHNIAGSPHVILHARTAHILRNHKTLVKVPRFAVVLLSIAVMASLLGFYLKFKNALIYSLGGVALLSLLVISFLFYNQFIIVPVLELMTGVSLFTLLSSIVSYQDERWDYRYLHNLFSTYISPSYIETMASKHHFPELGGLETHGTAFFSDIESFSCFSELLIPQDLILYLNSYFCSMTTILLENNGTLDKYIGDAIVAFFGAPLPCENHAEEACRTALLMQKTVKQLRDTWCNEHNFPKEIKPIKIRIGVNSGSFVTGNIGCHLRMNYTMIGDTVNLAERLESAAKQYGIHILVGEETRNACGSEFVFRELDTVRVMGRDEPTRIYELICFRNTLNDVLSDYITKYEYALTMYYEGNFQDACEQFEQLFDRETPHKDISPSRVLFQRCRAYLLDPPKQWDGVFNLEQK